MIEALGMMTIMMMVMMARILRTAMIGALGMMITIMENKFAN